ncbi:MAG: sel1 repeat family protein [Deltaproteobacteria bacterium]|jgi:TPR repeat protein|nr:sel1 repeat family protein [Deltaproteobacteria bacterium]
MAFDNPGESAQSIFETGKRFYVSPETADLEMARDCFEKAAGLGYPPAQRLLGIMYLEGSGVQKNLKLARQWLTLASDRGDSLASFRLAQIYATGLGVEKDWSKAYGLLSSQNMADIPEAMDLKGRLKSEIIRLYPNLATALENEENKVRRALTRRQHRFIPNFFGPVRSEDDYLEFETWLSLNLGRISAQEAFGKLIGHMRDYYRSMTKLYPESTVG